ncbi:MAG: helicase-related protein [Anaeromicrobium sp.]|jgi:SNF2 family DNA or RNA helicase|uniref:helicase-related protein n=1 Tax=Anaeromicrobium sp. TaxID=1929132 RepID=UPI0025F9E82E|nr:helicase-related protein [Anaeromicrobium sp.]MCT4594355.1 helicase-related protein [Anaeromicrobium sp.]
MDQPRILDNKALGKVGDVLKENLRKGSKLSVVSAYFTIYAFRELRKELSRIEDMRLLFVEPTFTKQQKEEKREFYINKNHREKQLSNNEFEIKIRNKLNQSRVAKECANWLKEKAQIKSLINPNSAHTKLFHINNREDGLVIQGSSDFTTAGLGFTNSTRMDINTCIKGKTATNQMLSWFDDIWNNESLVEDVKQEVLQQMETIYKENTPEFIYFITLYNIFNDYLDELNEDNIVKTKTGFKDTSIWNKLYKFQKDGVIGAVDKLEKYNGCIIADSVGLGKTFEALAIIKYYELRNYRVLVLCPKKLRDNWTIYTVNDKRNILVDDRFNYDVLNHTDLSREKGKSGEINLETINWSNYDLIVIDESHNFRNNDARKDRETRYSRLMNEVIKKGVKTKVLMLSATPVNNRMNDLKNQVAFITEGIDSAFEDEGIDSIEKTLRKAQTLFNRWIDLPDNERNLDKFLEMMRYDYFKLLDIVTIARSRKHIEKYYDMKDIGKFPERLKPENIKADIDLKDEFPPLKDINKNIKRLNLSAYSPLKYVKREKRAEYSKKYDVSVRGGTSVFKQTDREQSLINLMRVNLLKRMESSINSFGMTIAKLLKQIDRLVEKIHNKQFHFDASLNINDIQLDDDLLEDLLIGNKVKVLLQDIDLIKWKQDLEDDKEKLEDLLIETAKINSTRDAKLKILKNIIQNKIENPINNSNKKIIVFTAFADTANYLYEEISKWSKEYFDVNCALVTGSGNNQTTMIGIKKDLNTILTNFSPVSKERDKVNNHETDEIDILIATDCISEGQNLQDCDYLINYDIHWNPVRIIQRFGRIDRLGSKNDVIQLVNFWPNMELDEYINLEARVSGRMVLLDVSATGEENIIEQSEKKKMNDLEYRKKQLKQLQDEVVDIEEMSGGISITDLTMNDFKMDLMEYMKENEDSLEKAHFGMYAISEIEDESLKDQIKPGIIFCLKQVSKVVKVEENNALYPYYMVYVYEDGTVRYNYLHTKKILDFYKKLCSGKNQILSDLVDTFNKETNDGKNMNYYTELLEEAINSVIGKKEEKGIQSLFTKGGTTLLQESIKGLEDFELVSFLIIK